MNCRCSRARRLWRDDGTCATCRLTVAEVSIMDAVKAVLVADPACLLWRNEIGHNTHFPDGTRRNHPIAYGVGNPGGADLLGLYGTAADDPLVEVLAAARALPPSPAAIQLLAALAALPAVTPRARFLAVETKTPTGRLSPDQHRFGSWVARRGGIYAVVRSVDQARALLAWLRGQGPRPEFVFAPPTEAP